MSTAEKAKHTPGPWEVSSPSGELGIYGGDEAALKIAIACKYEIPPEARGANARLIAAAPKMADALLAAESIATKYSTIPELAAWWAQVAEPALREAGL